MKTTAFPRLKGPAMRFILLASSASLCLVLLGCGGSGGGEDGNNDGGTVVVTGTQLGMRAVPGFSIEVLSPVQVQAGATLTVQATVKPDAGVAPPVQVEAAIGTVEPTLWTAGTLSGGIWTWTVTLPANLTDQRVWVRLVDADGNSAASGGADFALLP